MWSSSSIDTLVESWSILLSAVHDIGHSSSSSNGRCAGKGQLLALLPWHNAAQHSTVKQTNQLCTY